MFVFNSVYFQLISRVDFHISVLLVSIIILRGAYVRGKI